MEKVKLEITDLHHYQALICFFFHLHIFSLMCRMLVLAHGQDRNLLLLAG